MSSDEDDKTEDAADAESEQAASAEDDAGTAESEQDDAGASEQESKSSDSDAEEESGEDDAEGESGEDDAEEESGESDTGGGDEHDSQPAIEPPLTKSVGTKPGKPHWAFDWHNRGYLARQGRPSWKEILLVTAVALAIFLPGLGSYTLIDPWESHYAEVARRMLQDDDLVHTKWQNEGFRSKPVLTFWMIAGGMQSLGIGDHGGYSGEMVSSGKVMFAIRYPFTLFGVMGLVMLWWMLSSLVNRRTAWIAFLVTASTPFYFLIARQAITDMPLVGCLMGSVACFAMALHAGDDELEPFWKGITSYHLFLAVIGLFIGWQLIYYAVYFTKYPRLARGMNMPQPQLVIPLLMASLAAVFVFWHQIWRPKDKDEFQARLERSWLPRKLEGAAFLLSYTFPVLNFLLSRITFTLVGATTVLTFILTMRLEMRVGPQVVSGIRLGMISLSLGAAGFLYFAKNMRAPMWSWWYERTTKRRQVYMYWFFALIGISVLGKGLPGIGLAGATCLFYVLLTNSWGELRKLEIQRGLILVVLIVVPWHLAMLLKDGRVFIRDYIMAHNFKRATGGMHGERGTFNFFMSQIGIGFWPWVALLPAAVASFVGNISPRTQEGRVRLIIGIWAISSIALFSAVQTKFHHYVFPAIPALALIVAFYLDDLLTGRARYTWLLAIMAAIIGLLVMRDLLGEQKQLIELFIYRYDRPWPSGPPWNVDVTDTIFGFGVAFTALMAFLLIKKTRPYLMLAILGTGVVWAYWGMNGYMGAAAPHWGMRAPVRSYYKARQVYGIDIRYWGTRELSDEWKNVDDEYMVKSFIPDEFAAGLQMKVDIAIVDYRNQIQKRIIMKGHVSRFASDRFWIKLAPAELAKLKGLIEEGRGRRRARIRPWRMVNADRLIAWQLYWRGENFWSGDEIWSKSEDTRTAFKQIDNKQFLKYLKTPSRAGRRFYVMTEAGRAPGLRNLLPTPRAKATFRILDTSCNKFTLLTFTL